MKLSFIHIASLFYSCKTREEELLTDEKIKNIKNIAKTNKNIVVDGSYIFMMGDIANTLNIEKKFIEDDITHILSYNNFSEEVDIKGIKFFKDDCIKMLDKKIKEDDYELKLLLYDLFNNEKVEDFLEKLINSQFKYVVQEKINTLQSIIKDDNLKLKWR